MGASFYGELLIRITADNKALTAGLAKSGAEVESFSKGVQAHAAKQSMAWERIGLGLQNMGRMGTQFFTTPMAVGFGLATYSAIKFENTLLKISNLTGLTTQQSKKYGDSILAMSKNVGVGPQKLAEAFYFIASSGFKANEAMRALNAAAKGSAAGLGDVTTVADVLTGAMNAYGHSNLSAAHAVDILMKTIEVGKAEPEQLTKALGRIMPIASQLGVSLGETGGMIAGLTLTNLSAAEAVTALRGTMMALTAPAKISIEQFKEIGLTYQEVTRSIKDKGLIATLQMLYEKVDGNMLAMRKMIPNTRALNGVLSLLGENYKKNVEIVNEVIDSNGKLDEAFENTRTNTIQKLKVAWASIQASFINIGRVMLPLLADVATAISHMFDAFDRLPTTQKKVILWAAGITAALFPLMMVVGSLSRGISLLIRGSAALTAARAASAAGGAAAAGAGGIGLAAGGALAGLAAMVPQAAIAAVVATAIAIGAKKGIEVGRAELAAGVPTWKAVLDGVWAGVKEPGLWTKRTVDQMMFGDSWDQQLVTRYSAVMDRLANISKDRMIVNAQELSNELKTRFDQLRANTDFLKDIDPGEVKTRAGMKRITSAISRELDIGMKEARMLVTLAFPDLIPQKAVTSSKKHLADLQAELARFTRRMESSKVAGDIVDVNKMKKNIARVTKEIEEVTRDIQRETKKWQQAGSVGAEGFAKGAESKKERAKSAGKALIKFLSVPWTTGALDALNAGKLVGGNFGGGVEKGKGGKKNPGQALATKTLEPLQAAAGEASSAGANVGSSYASALAAQETLAYNAGLLVGMAGARGVKDGAAVGSPSKKGLYYGLMVAEGFRLGIKSGTAKAAEEASTFAQNVMGVLEGALGIGTSITSMREQGLPTLKVARAWAKKAAALIRATVKAMQAEFKNIDVGSKTKGKEAGWKADRFGQIVGMGEGVGSLLSAFMEFTPEKMSAALAAMKTMKTKAKVIAAEVKAIVSALQSAFKGTIVTEFSAGNVGRVLEMVSNLANVIGAFVELGESKIKSSLANLQVAKDNAVVLAAYVLGIVTALRDAFAAVVIKTKVTETIAAAIQMVSDLGGIISTFADLTAEKMAAAESMLRALSEGKAKELADLIQKIVKSIVDVWVDPGLNTTISESMAASVQLAGDVGTIISTFAEMTATSIEKAITGLTAAEAAVPRLIPALNSFIQKLKDAFVEVKGSKELSDATAIAASIVGDIASIVQNLVELTIEKINDAIGGAWTAGNRAKKLTAALMYMVQSFAEAVGVVDLKSMGDVTKVLEALGAIASSIAGIVNELANLTAENIAAAQASGAALGSGFLAGLRSMHDQIVAEARRIVEDTTTALGGGSGGGGGSVAARTSSGYGSKTAVAVVHTDNSSLTINLPPSLSPAQAQQIAQQTINDWEARKTAAMRTAERGRI